MNKKIMTGIFAGLLITSLSTGFAATSDPFADDAYLPVDRNWKAFENQTKVKGIYVTGNAIGYNKKFDQLLDLAVTTEINAMIIDVNNDSGHFTYPTQVPMAVAEGLNNAPLSPKFSVNWDRLKAENVYTVARVVTFKNSRVAEAYPDLAIQYADGSVWRDKDGNAWLNAYNPDAWEYPLDIALEAVKMGFDEIQFDYVRFPDKGKLDLIDYKEYEGADRNQAIADFLQYATDVLSPYGVRVSADIFGQVTISRTGEGVGHQLETLADACDVLSPMVYPSHFYMNTLGVKYPDSDPYPIIYGTMTKAHDRIEVAETSRKKALMRPWLQDFSAPWIKRDYGINYVSYGPKQVRAQIEATYDAGYEEWILWSASNNYTREALLPEGVTDSEGYFSFDPRAPYIIKKQPAPKPAPEPTPEPETAPETESVPQTETPEIPENPETENPETGNE